jgi:EpsI family protein
MYVGRDRSPLAEVIPESFEDWHGDTAFAPITPAPDVQAKLDQLYSDTLSRSYVNTSGLRVMLSIAFGEDQGRTLQVHKPETCYAAQGFAVGNVRRESIGIGDHGLPVMRLVGTRGPRVEPITYWIRIGGQIARGWAEQNARRLEFGLRGTIPDGLLFRVSSISSESESAYAVHDAFIAALLGSVSPKGRRMLVGDALSGAPSRAIAGIAPPGL